MKKEIKLDDLKVIFNLIIEKLEFEEIKTINVENDAYRYIPTDSWNIFEKDEIELGSLFDDVNELKQLVTNDEHPCTFVDFDRLAFLLRFISEKFNSPT